MPWELCHVGSWQLEIPQSPMTITSSARRVARLLKSSGLKVAFAESCTGGLVSGSLTKIPGISEHHCGGVVVYRNETKAAYLDIPRKLLDDPGPVSRPVAELMARRVLDRTPEADLSAAVTGHLGPNAPATLDGLVFIAIAVRKPATIAVHELRCHRHDSRVVRQRWVVERVLELLTDVLAGKTNSGT
jgi:PncC family amidohydrolase